MKTFPIHRIIRFLEDDDGPTSVEYAVMFGLILMVCIAAVGILGNNTQEVYSSFSQAPGVSSDGS